MSNEKEIFSGLNTLAADAKRKLEDQLKNGEDIYASMREKDEESVEGKIKLKDDSVDERVDIKIKTKPDEKDFEDMRTEPIMPYDEPMFENGPTVSEVEAFKKIWAGYDVYATQILEQYFIFRTLGRFEYKQIVALKNTDPIMREEIFCETCVLWPDNYDYKAMAVQKAGIPSTLSQIIMEKSGFTKEYTIQVL